MTVFRTSSCMPEHWLTVLANTKAGTKPKASHEGDLPQCNFRCILCAALTKSLFFKENPMTRLWYNTNLAKRTPHHQ